VEVPLQHAITLGDTVTVMVIGATNQVPGTFSDFEVYTVPGTAPGVAPAYTIGRASLAGSSCLAPPATCYSPQAYRAAYGVAPLVAKGIDGKGRKIVLPEMVDQANDTDATDIFSDISAYDAYFHLPPAHLSVVPSAMSKTSPDIAGLEEAEDVEVAHAVAPGAALEVVLVGRTDHLEMSMLASMKGADVASLSWASPEACPTTAQLDEDRSLISQAVAGRTTVIADSGDYGAAVEACTGWTGPERGVYFPASDPLVLGVGGTTLTAAAGTGAYVSEVAWNSLNAEDFGQNGVGPMASGGGSSDVFARPAYQDGVPGIGASRGVPDVAGDASETSGLALIFELDGGSSPAMYSAAGTSEATPLWAGIIALADQYAGRDLGPVGAAIYLIGKSPAYHAAFHDVTKGNNTIWLSRFVNGITLSEEFKGYEAGPGWDPVTGWGTPVASVLVPLLAHDDAN
jgi:subtilase family serine protease